MKSGEIPDRKAGILNRVPVYILLLFITVILTVSLFIRAEYCGYRYYDNPVWSYQNTPMLLLSGLSMLISYILIYRLGKSLNRLSRAKVIICILYLSAVIQILFILSFPARQFADQDIVNQISLDIIQGDYRAFRKGGYLYQYPNNVGITLLLSVIYRVLPQTLFVPKLLNVVFSSVTSLLIFRIYEEVTAGKRKNDYGMLIFSCFFLPMILLNNLVYNDIYATTLFAGLVYSAVRFVRRRKISHLIAAAILLMAGNFLRQVGIVFLLAVTLYFIIKKVELLKAIAFFGIVLVLCKLPLFMVNTSLIGAGKIEEPVGLNSIPVHMWLHIGMNERKFGYWDDSYSWNFYIEQGGWNKAKSRDIYTEMIKKSLREKGLSRLAQIYFKKNCWLWTEGTYQAEYYGIGSWGYLYPTGAAALFNSYMEYRDAVRWILHVKNLLMLGFIAVGLVSSLVSKCDYPLLLPAIVLLGFIGFYTLWEIKPRYIYLIYPYLVLMSYHGLRITTTVLKKLTNRAGKA